MDYTSHLFKAKVTEGGNWMRGDLIHHPAYTTLGCVDSDGLHELQIQEDTISICTGKRDKNKAQMWENDIVTGLFHHGRPIVGVVAFRDGAFGLQWNRETDFHTIEEFTPFSALCNIEYEVIGNKFDNSELLEQEQPSPQLFR